MPGFLSLIGGVSNFFTGFSLRTWLIAGLSATVILTISTVTFAGYRYVTNMQQKLIQTELALQQEAQLREIAESNSRKLIEDLEFQKQKSAELEKTIEENTAEWDAAQQQITDMELQWQKESNTNEPADPTSLNSRNAALNRMLERRNKAGAH